MSSIIRNTISKIESIVQRDDGNRGIKELIVNEELYNSTISLINCKNVAIITGFPCLVDFKPPTETDGPLGSSTYNLFKLFYFMC